MGRERWFRGGHEGRERPFDWYTLAKERDIPLEQAHVLYEEALRRARAHQSPHRNAEALYLELLEEAHQEAWRPSPGKVSRTMLLTAERSGKKRPKPKPLAPGKRTLTSYLKQPDHVRRNAKRAEQERERLEAIAESFRTLGMPLPADLQSALARVKQAEPVGQAPEVAEGAEVDNLASPDATTRTAHPARERLVPGTAAYRRFQANVLAAHGHFEELDALDAEEERLEAELATVMEASQPSDKGGEDTTNSEVNGWPQPPELQSTLEQQAREPSTSAWRVHAAEGQSETSVRHTRWPAEGMPFQAQTVDEEGDLRPLPAVTGRPVESWGTAGPIQAAGMQGGPEEPLHLPEHDGGAELPEDVRAKMEAAFGVDFTPVRIHEGPHVEAIGALAYTQGTNIHFAPGQYQPTSPRGQELLGHELTHVVQQSQGRVAATGSAKSVPLNDDPALEEEADELGARAARGEKAAPGGAVASGGGDTAQRKADPVGEAANGVESSGEEMLSATGDAATPTAQARMRGAPIQARVVSGPIQRQKQKTYVPHTIHVDVPMTQEQFRVKAMIQVFGKVIDNVEWKNSKDSYVPENSPYTLNVDVDLLRLHRGQASKSKGIDVGEGGTVAGADGRAKKLHSAPPSADKNALMAEIDRRYYAATGTNTKIKPGEKGKAELWFMIRDEVLFQHEYIANLPPQVKALIKSSTEGKELTPADYEKLFAIAKKIEKMPAGQVSDYASKVTGATTDLDKLEASLDKYLAEMVEREKQGEEREKVHTKLIGLEEVYKKYKLYNTLLLSGSGMASLGGYRGGAGGIVVLLEAEEMRKELETQLQAHGFAGVTEFEEYIERFEKAFEQEAANIAKDLLGKYAGKLYKESERYKNPAEVAALHQKLGGVRTKHAEFEANATIWNNYLKDRLRIRIPGQGHLHPKTTLIEAEAAKKKAEEAKAAAQSQVQGMSGDHPIFQEEGIPLDKRIDKVALAKASEAELGGLLQGYIQRRQEEIGQARGEIDGKTELIYKMDKLMPHFYAQQGIQPGSIHDMIIQDKIRDDVIRKLVVGVALAIVAVALAVVTFGAATPAIVAAGAGVSGAGLGVYMALEEYKEYTAQKNLSDVGFADDPSVVWLVIAIVGAGLDMAAAAKAVSALGKAAKALDAGGELAEFNKVVKELEKAGELEARAARAAEKAAAARKGFAEASTELTKAMAGKMYSFPGPLADPEVYEAVVKMARQAIKTKVYDAQKFIDELKLARVKAGLGDLAPEELAKAKQAWEEAKALEAAANARYQKLLAQVPDATKLDALIVKAGDVEKLERLLKVFPEAELQTIFAQLKDTGRLATMVEHVGPDSAGKMIRQWMAKGKTDKMNTFLETLAGGAGKELAETVAVGTKSVIIDSQTVIALTKDAAGQALQDGEKLMVKYIKGLPAGTELRAGNVTIGEVGSGAVKMKGLPLDVARDSSAYKKVLAELERMNVGGGKGAADRALVADAFFAKTDPGIVPRFATADKNVFNKLATEAGIELDKLGGKTLSQLHPGGFEVTVGGRKLHVVPIEP